MIISSSRGNQMINNQLVKTLLTAIVEDEDNLPIVEALADGIETDEEIAEKTGIRLNIVRKILYKLYDMGLASYKRSKDPETQWYTYTWKYEEDEVYKKVIKEEETKIEMLNKALETEENNMFFVCPQQHVRLDFDISSEYDFICPECGEELEFFDNADYLNQIKQYIKDCEKEFKNFKKELKKYAKKNKKNYDAILK